MKTFFVFTRIGLIATAATFLARVPVEAQPLQPATELRKLSLHLRGRLPDLAEYAELSSNPSESNHRTVLQRKAHEYMHTPEHADKMSFRLEELFRLLTDPLSSTPIGTSQGGEPFQRRNSLNELFRSLARQNRSWDELLTGKRYELFAPSEVFEFTLNVSDYGFFGAIAPDRVPPVSNGTLRSLLPGPVPPRIDLEFASDDPRVAGALTTPRFLQRYGNTGINKNRRRAAAVFRIFLCDSMLAVVPPPSGALDRLLDRAFPPTSDITESDIRAMVGSEEQHGSNQACASCHYKLDPMGRAFLGASLVLSPEPVPGSLTYRDERQNLIHEPAAGLGDLASAITRQPDYARCQVRQFWTWFIGADRPLSLEREDQLVARFNDVGRRTNDFIAELVGSQEFREIQARTPEQVRADSVRLVLRKCSSCHDETKPDFTVWPIGGSRASMQRWVGRISRSLDFEGDGAQRTMPPPTSPWQPTRSDFDLLRNWIRDGAPDETGAPQT